MHLRARRGKEVIARVLALAVIAPGAELAGAVGIDAAQAACVRLAKSATPSASMSTVQIDFAAAVATFTAAATEGAGWREDQATGAADSARTISHVAMPTRTSVCRKFSTGRKLMRARCMW